MILGQPGLQSQAGMIQPQLASLGFVPGQNDPAQIALQASMLGAPPSGKKKKEASLGKKLSTIGGALQMAPPIQENLPSPASASTPQIGGGFSAPNMQAILQALQAQQTGLPPSLAQALRGV